MLHAYGSICLDKTAHLQSGKHTAKYGAAVTRNTTPLQTGRTLEKTALAGRSLVSEGRTLFESTPCSDQVFFATTKRAEWRRPQQDARVQFLYQTIVNVHAFKGKEHCSRSNVQSTNGLATVTSTHRYTKRSHAINNNAQHGSAETKAPSTGNQLYSVRTKTESCKIVKHKSSVVDMCFETTHIAPYDRHKANPAAPSPIHVSNEITDEKLSSTQQETPLFEMPYMKSPPARPSHKFVSIITIRNGFPANKSQTLQSPEETSTTASLTVPKELLSPAECVASFELPELFSISTEEIRQEVQNVPTEDIRQILSSMPRDEKPQDLQRNPQEQLHQERLNNTAEEKYHKYRSNLLKAMPQEAPSVLREEIHLELTRLPREDARQKYPNSPIGQISPNLSSTENEQFYQESPRTASVEVQTHGTSKVTDEILTENCDSVEDAKGTGTNIGFSLSSSASAKHQQHGITFSTPVQDSNATADNTLQSGATEIQQRSHTLHCNRRKKMKLRKQQSGVMYRMDSRPKGRCIIINNETFDGFETREGTAADKESLKATFEQLGFQVICFNDLSDKDIVREIQEEALRDQVHRRYDSFVCCILSHGNLRTVYGSNGVAVPIDDIIRPFRAQACPSLAGKPKIFIIQACQGEYEQSGHPAANTQSLCHDIDVEKESEKRLIPNEADILLCFSTVPGTRSYRHRNIGSLYIRSLTKHLTKRLHLVDILTLVNKDVGKEEIVGRGGMCKQSPYFESSLTKFLFLCQTPSSQYTNAGALRVLC